MEQERRQMVGYKVQEIISGKETKTQSFEEESTNFFGIFREVVALARESGSIDGALALFRASERELESRIQASGLSGSRPKDLNVGIANYQSLLGLVHWLNPNHQDFDRKSNAKKMLHNAKEALRLSSQTIESESYATGLFVQLRILRFS